MLDDAKYINKFPDDAAEMAELVRQDDLQTAVMLLQLWGSKQRDIGALNAIEMLKEKIHGKI